MRILSTEPSSVFLSQTKYFIKLKSDAKNVHQQAEAKMFDVINPQIYDFNQFYTRKNLNISKCYESTKVDHKTWVPLGTLWSNSSDTHQVVEERKEET